MSMMVTTGQAGIRRSLASWWRGRYGAQLAFEVTAILEGANSASRLTDSVEPYARARVALAGLVQPA